MRGLWEAGVPAEEVEAFQPRYLMMAAMYWGWLWSGYLWWELVQLTRRHSP